MQNTGKGLSVTGLVLGIISAALCWVSWVNLAAIICGIIGIVCASKGKKAAVAAGAPTGVGTAGLVLSIIGTILSSIGFLSCTLCATAAIGALNSL